MTSVQDQWRVSKIGDECPRYVANVHGRWRVSRKGDECSRYDDECPRYDDECPNSLTSTVVSPSPLQLAFFFFLNFWEQSVTSSEQLFNKINSIKLTWCSAWVDHSRCKLRQYINSKILFHYHLMFSLFHLFIDPFLEWRLDFCEYLKWYQNIT